MFSRSHYSSSPLDIVSRYRFAPIWRNHGEELQSHSRVVALLLRAERVLGSVHDWHFVILSTIALQVTHILLHRPSLNHRIATLAIVVTTQPICDRPRAAAHVAKQELSARNFRNIYRHLRLRCRNSKNREHSE